MPVELYMLDKLKARIQLAREIEGLQHKVKKEKHERNWLKEAAEAMEIELDSDLARCVPGRGGWLCDSVAFSPPGVGGVGSAWLGEGAHTYIYIHI